MSTTPDKKTQPVNNNHILAAVHTVANIPTTPANISTNATDITPAVPTPPTTLTTLNQPAGLDSLPCDVVELICDELSMRDVNALSSTCSQLWRLILPYRRECGCWYCGRSADLTRVIVGERESMRFCKWCINRFTFKCDSCGWYDARPHLQADADGCCDGNCCLRTVHREGNCWHDNCAVCEHQIVSFTDAFKSTLNTPAKSRVNGHAIDRNDVICRDCGDAEKLPYGNWWGLSGAEHDRRYDLYASGYTSAGSFLGLPTFMARAVAFYPVCYFCERELVSYSHTVLMNGTGDPDLRCYELSCKECADDDGIVYDDAACDIKLDALNALPL